MAGFPVLTGISWSVDDVPMQCPAWYALNPQTLMQGPAVIVANRRQAGTIGRKAFPAVADETKLSVRFAITGVVDINGDPYDNPVAGLVTNYLYLRENVFDPADPVRVSTVELEDGSLYQAEIQFDPFPLGDAIVAEVQGNLGVTIVGGAHQPVGS